MENRFAALETAMWEEVKDGIARESANLKKGKRMNIVWDKGKIKVVHRGKRKNQRNLQQRNQQKRTALCHESQRLAVFSKGYLRQHKFLSLCRAGYRDRIEKHT